MNFPLSPQDCFPLKFLSTLPIYVLCVTGLYPNHGPGALIGHREGNVLTKMRWLLILVGLGLLSGCGSNGGDPGGNTDPDPGPRVASVSGSITFKGIPLSGATVTAYVTNTNSIAQTVTADASGNYTFSSLQAGGNVPTEYQFWATKAGYGFYPSVGSGAKVMRAGMNGQFAGLNTGNVPIDFIVIDWVPQPYSTLSGANFAAYDGSNPLVNVAATGQSFSYASGDDGAQRKGVAWPASRFTDNTDGTVTDHLTGLIWLQNAGCFNATDWTTALVDVNTLAAGQCRLSDASVAGQWRLPNLNELESLVDVSAGNPALPAGNVFTNVSTGIYWTSTAYWGGALGSTLAWGIRLSDGRFITNPMGTSSNAVWAVKGVGGGAVKLSATGFHVATWSGDDGTLQMGVGLPNPRWLDNGNGTVTDIMTGLIWLKQADCINQPWAAALTAVSQLASGQCGLTDGSVAGAWRMPNRNEMQSTADRMQTNASQYFNYAILNLNDTVYQPAIFTNFMATQYYWTSTTNAANTSEAWAVYSCDYGVYDESKANAGYALAVR